MEIFEVIYKGQKANAVKINNSIYVKLPARYGEKGSEFKETISKDSIGWKFSSSIVDKPEYSFNLWFREDGRIAFHNSKEDKMIVTKEPFNPDMKRYGKLYSIATELYRTIEQLEAYEKRDIPASSICEDRLKKLESTLKLLGYPNIEDVAFELDDSKGYLALRRIREQLKKYINLGAYVHLEGSKNKEDIIRVNVSDRMTRQAFEKLRAPVIEEDIDNREFMEKQNDKKDILMDYCAQLSKKMPYKEWILYSNVVKKTTKLLLELNADLVSEKYGLQISDLSQLTEKELNERIYSLINSKEFSMACEIEDRVFEREAERLISMIEFKLSEYEDVQDMSSNPIIPKILEDIKKDEAEMLRERKTQVKEEGIGRDE